MTEPLMQGTSLDCSLFRGSTIFQNVRKKLFIFPYWTGLWGKGFKDIYVVGIRFSLPFNPRKLFTREFWFHFLTSIIQKILAIVPNSQNTKLGTFCTENVREAHFKLGGVMVHELTSCHCVKIKLKTLVVVRCCIAENPSANEFAL